MERSVPETMIVCEPTKYGAGVTLWGDAHDLGNLHETIHELSRSEILGLNLSDFVLGLAYDVRKALEGMREEREIEFADSGEMVRYRGVRILWPVFLSQVGLLRFSAGYYATSRVIQADLYRLEACAHRSLRDYDTSTAQKCIDWLGGFSGLPSNYLVEFVTAQAWEFVFEGRIGKNRFRRLPRILRSLDPMSRRYQAFDAEISTVAAQNGRSPDDVRDARDWPEFRW